MLTYYNEWERYPAQWLWNLFPDGDVDERDIRDVGVGDVSSYDRVHLFAGIGGWEYALQLAGWPSDVPVWSGSCPCQPFSRAGKKKGVEDARHLWPEMFRLIEGNRPPVIFGEQVTSAGGLEWFDGVHSDLERVGYAVGMAVLPAACVGSPHNRERLFFVADTYRQQRDDADRRPPTQVNGRSDYPQHTERRRTTEPQRAGIAPPWASYQALVCADGKLRRVEPGIFPLAPRIPNTVGRLRAYGNVVVPQVAAVFIRAYMDARGIVVH